MQNISADAVVDRLQEAMGVSSDNALSEALGSVRSTVGSWRARNKIPFAECVRVSIEKQASMDWLLFGAGSKQLGGDLPNGSYSDPDYSEVPLYDVEASAGGGSLFDNEPIISYLKFRNDWMIREGVSQKDLVAIRVTGDSMDSTLADGDTVLIDRSRTRPDGVFAIRIGDGLRIKRLQQLVDGSLRVSSDNDMYAEETIPKENLGQVEIIGFCHWRGGRVF